MTLAELLYNHRKNLKLSLRKAAIEIGLSFSYLADLESGKRIHPKMYALNKIAKFYSISEDFLCIISERIPQDCFFKIIRCPELLGIIRNHPEK